MARLNLNDYKIISEPDLATLKGSCFAGFKIPSLEPNTGSLKNIKQFERMRNLKFGNLPPAKNIELKLYEYSKNASVYQQDI